MTSTVAARRVRRALVPFVMVGSGAALVSLGTLAAADGATTGCSATTGVTVIVDFSHWGGNVERGCAPGKQATGLDALRHAGFTSAGTDQYGDQFVCRIDGHPSADQESCASTPPANAYWAYYHAAAGARAWTYSIAGAAASHPAPGSIDAWAFGAHATPSVSPRDLVATPPSTVVPPTARTLAPPPPTVRHSTTTASPPAVNGFPSATTTDPSTAPTSRPGGPTTVAPSSVTRATDESTTSVVHIVERASAPGAPRPDTGSPWPAIIAVVAIAGLAAAAFAIARTRRPVS